MKIGNMHKTLPESSGVYLMKDSRGKILYIGKAANLRRRVSSYFLRPHDARIEKMVSLVARVDYKKTDSALEALILEAKLIKENKPPFNIREKDDKSFLYIEITDEKFPRVLLVRGKSQKTPGGARRYGPFVSGGNIREALRILRRIFPFGIHLPQKQVLWGTSPFKKLRPCFEYELGLCPGTCVGAISERDYKSSLKNLVRFLNGEKKVVIGDLQKRMKTLSRNLEFEKAAKARSQIFALKHIQDTALISDDLKYVTYNLKPKFRIEGYDISNISGIFATGSMVVFTDERPDRNQYRKFKISAVSGPNDTAMLKEVLSRRLRHREWPLPNLMLVDGGKAQVNAARAALDENGVSIPVLGIAKGPKRKKNEFIGRIPRWVSERVLIRIRNEAHRFAIKYHKKIRDRIL